MAPNVVDEGILITYHGILPMLVVLGVISSLISIWVLTRPSLKKTYVNRYFLVLAVYDLALNIFYIPIIVTATGCSIADYGSAWYFAHFGWTMACTFHALSTYVIVFLALDRFVGVWFPTWFKRLHAPPYGFWHRMAAVAVVCVGVHVPYMVDATVECCELDGQHMSRADLQCQSNDSSCSNGLWVSVDGYEYSFDETWHIVYRYFYMLIVRWLPSVLLLVFNISLVIAVCLGKVTFPGNSAKNEADSGSGRETIMRKGSRRVTRNSERILVATVIAMTASYILLTLPITIFLTGLADTGTERCLYSSPEETVRHVGNVLQLLEHVIHIFFLFFINPRFKREMLYQLRCREFPGEEGDTTTPDDQPGSGNRPISNASRSYRVRDSAVPLSCHPLRSDFS